MADDAHFPELARSLRALGKARDPATEAAHDAIFAPLIEARLRAAHASGRDVIGTLRGATLSEQIERGVVSAAAVGAEQPAVARARASQARELLEPIRAALVLLDDRAAAASAAGPGTPEWDAWLVALRAAFGAADLACGRLAQLLAIPPHTGQRPRWFGPRSA